MRRALETVALVVALSTFAVGLGWGVGLLGYCHGDGARSALCGGAHGGK